MTILAITLGIILAIAITQGLAQAQDIRDLECERERMRDELDDAHSELSELRCEYERSMFGTSYRWRSVNRISRRYPR